ncbi:hypothetical protein EJ08DRAFT_703556 [Tothia fuscella]|uniref:Uncharacterized protein n=1 Tax=Tothia fuscella TaxID=1048955 RepID=A0A9P4TSP0_9PEZI|nr:hypothetical protein EJ08DRAFT_703556 [Tothia fuscella]
MCPVTAVTTTSVFSIAIEKQRNNVTLTPSDLNTEYILRRSPSSTLIEDRPVHPSKKRQSHQDLKQERELKQEPRIMREREEDDTVRIKQEEGEPNVAKDTEARPNKRVKKARKGEKKNKA